MFERLKNSWALAMASARVLGADKELVVFPIISAVALVFVSATFIVPMFFLTNENGELTGPLSFIVGFAFYVASYFVIFFCNSALVGAALIRLRGGDPTVADGFRIAGGKVGTIFGYALVAATVGIILRAIQERAGLIGRIITGLIGVVWSVATFLVVPVLVTEDVSPIDAVKRSSSLLKKTWGEQVVGNFGIGSIAALATFAVMLIFIPLIIIAGGLQSGVVLALTVGGFALSLMAIALINATLSGIYTAAVYRYAAEGAVGEGFDPAMVQQAFRPK